MILSKFFITLYLFSIIFLSIFSVVNQNTIYSVISLMFIIILIAFLFLKLNFEFISFLLIILYVGAVLVLFVFTIIMLDINKNKNYKYLEYKNIDICGTIFFLLKLFFSIFFLLHSFFNLNFLEFNFFIKLFTYNAHYIFFAKDFFIISNIFYTQYYLGFLIIASLLLITLVCSIIILLDKNER